MSQSVVIGKMQDHVCPNCKVKWYGAMLVDERPYCTPCYIFKASTKQL